MSVSLHNTLLNSLFSDSSLELLREKYMLQLYQDSFSHIVRLFKDELVLPDVEPGFPDLHDDYKEPLLKDKTYTDFKTKKEKLVDQWNQHIQCAKKAKFVFYNYEQ